MKRISLVLCLILTVAFVGSAFADISSVSRQDVQKKATVQENGYMTAEEYNRVVEGPQLPYETIAIENNNHRGQNPDNKGPQPRQGDILDYTGSETFDADLGEFTNYTILGGGFTWLGTDGNPPGCAFYDDYQGDQDAYLVSNGYFTVPDADNQHLMFDQRDDYASYYVLHQVLVTDNFTGDPTTTTWDVLYEGVAPTAWTTERLSLEAYRGVPVVFAFHYVGNYADEWHIDNVMVDEYIPLPPPANDDCVDAEYLGDTFPITGSGTTIGATVDCPGVLDWNGVWYTFDVPHTSNDIYIQICPTAADLYNVGIVLMDDCNCDDYVIRDVGGFIYDVCPGGWTGYEMTFQAYPGPATVYWPANAQPSDFSGMDFDFTIDVTEAVPPPTGDTCDDPIIIDGNPVGYTDTQDNTQFQDDYGYSGPDVVYEFTLDSPMALEFQTCNSPDNFRAVLRLYDDCGVNELDYVAYSGCANDHALLTYDFADAGTYWLIVDASGVAPNTGTYTLEIDEYIPPQPPANDSCQNAEYIGDVVDYPFSTVSATASGLGTCLTSPDIWYVYTATCDGNATFSLLGSSYDTKMAVYDGVSCDPLPVEIECNDDFGGLQSQVTWSATAGTEYLVQVGGYSSNVGDGIINTWCELPPVPLCCQDPDTINWSLITSDTDLGYRLYDNFLCDDLTEIGSMQFFGGDLQYSGGWSECNEDPMPFEIKFYADNGGIPDTMNPVATFNVDLSGVFVTQLSGTYDLYEYNVTFDTPVALNEGWVSIQGIGNGDTCVFMWLNATDGDNLSYQEYPDGSLEQRTDDLARCMFAPTVSDLEIGMIPDITPPITLPAGSNFTYEGTLTNNTDGDLYTDVWLRAHHIPTGTYYGPRTIYYDLMVPANSTASWYPVVQNISAYAPLGDYYYIATCGEWPDNNIVDSTYFMVTVTAADGNVDDPGWAVYGWGESTPEIPTEFALNGNYPNPFNAETNISFDLPQNTHVNLEVYNLMGQKVETLVDGLMNAGQHTVRWDASTVSSGIYFYKLTAGKFTQTKKMNLLK
ncbi:MAG: T9SS type A sorting domain-containing protein [candidate division Zixibacteria bacterium]|nr:T9SS type A sorting domain-containing protein [candidate division Zixibacteria bacterium]